MERFSTRFLVIGLGSMGKRRIRNLFHLGYKNIIGFDIREDRRKEVSNLFGIETVSDFTYAVDGSKPDVFIISVPPDKHHFYIQTAFEKNIHFFVEASVLDSGYSDFVKLAGAKDIVAAPSCTLCFHPAIARITEFVRSGELGKISSILYHSGQYLPDWHTYEKVSDYYVSQKDTGGAREIVPFELSWITNSFGLPKSIAGVYKKTIDIEGAAKIDDTYVAIMEFPEFILNLTVDVVSRAATRKLTVNGSKKQLYWNWDDGKIQVFEPATGEWKSYDYEVMPSKEGYNRNITEQMYIDEVQCFLDAINSKRPFPNSLEHDWKVLRVLYGLEKSYQERKMIDL